MPADIVEDTDLVVLSAHDQQREAGRGHGDGIARVRHVSSEADAHPGAREKPLLLEFEELAAGVSAPRQPARLLDRPAQRLDHVWPEHLFDRAHRPAPSLFRSWPDGLAETSGARILA